MQLAKSMARRFAKLGTSLSIAAAGFGGAGMLAAQTGDFRTDVTLAQLMEAIVMPAADVVWNAPQFPEEGDQIVGPDTEEGWLAARHAALALAESANALLIPGRKVDQPGATAPEGELSPAEIEALITKNRGVWVSLAHSMHAAAMQAVAAIDAKDADKLLDVGGDIDATCQGCHRAFWYPNQ